MFKFKDYLKEQNNKEEEYKVIKTSGLTGGQAPKNDDYKPMETSGLSGGQPKNKININPIKEEGFISNISSLIKGAFSKKKVETVSKHPKTSSDDLHMNIYAEDARQKLNKSGTEETHGYEPYTIPKKEGGEDWEHDWDHPHARYIERIRSYTDGSYRLNSYLHDRDSGEGHPNEYNDDDAKKLSEAITQQKAKKDLYVYSGLRENPSNGKGIKDFKKDDEHPIIRARLPAFTSTSVHPAVAKKFTGNEINDDGNYASHMLKIKIPKGSKHGMYIGQHSSFNWENEFLLDKNKKLHIHPEPETHVVDEHTYRYNTLTDKMEKVPVKSLTHIWHAHIVD